MEKDVSVRYYFYKTFNLELVVIVFIFGQRPRREPEGTKSCRIQGGSVRPSVRTYVRTYVRPPPAPQRLAKASLRLAEASLRLAEVSKRLD